jgi:hypothetical protein
MISNSTVQIMSFFSGSQKLKSEFSIRIPQSSTRWHAHLCGLATAIHETSGIDQDSILVRSAWRVFCCGCFAVRVKWINECRRTDDYCLLFTMAGFPFSLSIMLSSSETCSHLEKKSRPLPNASVNRTPMPQEERSSWQLEIFDLTSTTSAKNVFISGNTLIKRRKDSSLRGAARQ